MLAHFTAQQSLICRPHRPQAEKLEKQIHKSNFPGQFSCTLAVYLFKIVFYSRRTAHCASWHILNNPSVATYLEAKTHPLVIDRWHKYRLTGKDTPISHKVSELHVVMVTIVRLLSICHYNMFSLWKNRPCNIICPHLSPFTYEWLHAYSTPWKTAHFT